MLAVMEGLESAESSLRDAGDELAAATRTMLVLMRVRFKLDAGQVEVLESVLAPDTVHDTEDGWEERVDASLVHLLKTCLTDTERDPLKISRFAMAPVDVGTAPFKKHIAQVCTQLDRGFHLKL